MVVRVARVAMLLMVTLVLVGCSEDNPLNRQGLSGSVTLNGEPVAKGKIKFTPMVQGSGMTMAGGMIVDGSYSVETAKGLAPGEYAVNIGIPDPNSETKVGVNPKNLAPPDYAKGTEHTIKVEAGGSNVFDFELKTK